MAKLAKFTHFRRLIKGWKGRTTVAAVMAAAAATCGFVLLSPRPSSAASVPKPAPVPTAASQIRAELLKGELGLAEKGILEDSRALSRKWVRSLSPAQRAALAEQMERLMRSQRSKPLPKAPALKAGLHYIRYGVGPWGYCAFYAHNLYVTPPAGRSGVQYEVYAGSVPVPRLCAGTDPAATPWRGRGAIIEGTYNTSPPREPALIRSPFNSPLVIISAHADIVELRTLSGHRLTFNVVTRKFDK
jgi:hypothetical protein